MTRHAPHPDGAWTAASGLAALALAVLVLAVPAAPARAQEASPSSGVCRLVDATAGSGLDFVHDRGTSPEKHLPETMGAGVAFLDHDGDGWPDLYAVQSGPFPPPEGGAEAAADRLFRNLGTGPGTGRAAGRARFVDATAAAGVVVDGCGQGAVAADVDGDGDLDLLVTQFGPDAWLENRGDGTFAPAGPGLDGWSSSAAFADADGDGDLDLYVGRYVEYDPAAPIFCEEPGTDPPERAYCDPSLFAGASDRLLENREAGAGGSGPGSRFVAVDGAAAGIGAADGRGLGVLFVDLDADGRADLYVANDLTLNFLFANRSEEGGPLRFEDLSLLSGAAVNREGKPEAGMGLAVGDVDGDGDPDLAVTNFDVETNTLYENLGDLQFEDVAAASGFGVPSFNRLGFGLVMEDFTGDGLLDAYVANGHIFDPPRRPDITYAQPDLLLAGDGRGGFRSVDCPAFADEPRVGRGLAVADVDRDGDADLAVSNNGGPLQLLVTEGAPERWLGVRLVGAAPNTEAVGAVVTLETDRGPRRRWIVAGDSYQSSSDKDVRFLLAADEEVRALTVRWPGGAVQRLASPAPDARPGAYLRLLEPVSAPGGG